MMFTNDRYELAARLGSGNMGNVYAALDRLTRQPVALKHVTVPAERLQFTQRSDQRITLAEALAREFTVLASLRHPQIISVLDYGFDQNRHPFYTMDLINSPQTLLDYSRGLPLERQIQLLIDTLQALAYLHRRGVVHRDLKPGNILVSGGVVRVVDFGMALAPGLQAAEVDDIPGTLYYLPPEVINGETATIAADLYAFGVIAFELFTGAHPFPTTSIARFIRQVTNDPPDLSRLPTPELAEICGRLLAKDPAQRYPDAESVMVALCAAAQIRLPEETSAIRESFLQAATFVGREPELAALTQALDRILNTDINLQDDDTRVLRNEPVQRKNLGSVWLIGGESGVGKSRLIEELRIRALVGGALTVRGSAVAGAHPFTAWHAPLQRLALSSPLTDPDLAALRNFVPDLEQIIGFSLDADTSPINPQMQREHLFQVVLKMLALQSQPVVIILEDLQWAEDYLLARLIPHVARLPLLVIGSYRDDESPNLPDRLSGAQVLRLERLDDAAMAQLASAMLGDQQIPDDLLELLRRETEGNALFLVEVMRELAIQAGRLSEVSAYGVPDQLFAGGIREVIHRRLMRTPSYAHPVLALAAVMGRQIDFMALHQAYPGSFDLEAWARTCAESAVLEIHDGQWRFTHDKLREILLERIPSEDRAQLYRAAAISLERAYDDLSGRAALMADLWETADEPDRAGQYAALAAEYAYADANWKEALALAERGIRLLASDHPYRARALHMAGESCRQIGNFSMGLVYLEEGLHLARQQGDLATAALILSGLGGIMTDKGDKHQAHEYLNEALKLARQSRQPYNLLLVLGVTSWLALTEGDLETLDATASERLQLARHLQIPGEIARALNSLGLVAERRGRLVEAEQFYYETLQIAQQERHTGIESRALKNLGTVAELKGDFTTARFYLQQSLRLTQETRDQWGQALVVLNLAWVYLRSGHPEAAYPHLRDGLRIARDIQTESMMLFALAGFAWHALYLDQMRFGVELLGLVLNHPSTDRMDAQKVRTLLLPLYEDQLSPEGLMRAFQRSNGADLYEVTQRLLH